MAIVSKFRIGGGVVFDEQAMTLSCGSTVTALTANEAELLSMLMKGAVRKRAVIEQVWEKKGFYVADGSYHQLVRALRIKLAAQGIEKSSLKTLPRLGLRFIEDVELHQDTDPSPASESFCRGSILEMAEEPVAVPTPVESAAAVEPVIPAISVELVASAPRPQRQANGRFLSARTLRIGVFLILTGWLGILTFRTFQPCETSLRFMSKGSVDGARYFSGGQRGTRRRLGMSLVFPMPEVDMSTRSN